MFDLFTCALFAQDALPQPRSRIEWYFAALGDFYAVVIPLTSLVLFIGCCVVLARFKSPAVAASFVIFLPAPVLMGLLCSLTSFLDSGEVIASGPVVMKVSELWHAIAVSVIPVMFALMLALPSYFVLSVGLFVKTLRNAREPTTINPAR